MTVTTTTTVSGPYYPNGATVTFPFGFKVFDKTDIRVYDGSNGGDVPYDASLYSVTVGDTGGSITFSTPPAAGPVLYIALDPAFTNNISFGIEEAFFPQGHNEGFDRAALRDQVLLSRIADLETRLAAVAIGGIAALVLPDEANGDTLPATGSRLPYHSGGVLKIA